MALSIVEEKHDHCIDYERSEYEKSNDHSANASSVKDLALVIVTWCECVSCYIWIGSNL